MTAHDIARCLRLESTMFDYVEICKSITDCSVVLNSLIEVRIDACDRGWLDTPTATGDIHAEVESWDVICRARQFNKGDEARRFMVTSFMGRTSTLARKIREILGLWIGQTSRRRRRLREETGAYYS